MISKQYCYNLSAVENFEEALNSNERYVLHHRLETHFSDGIPRPKNAQLTREELVALDMYYNRPPEEFIYLSYKEHNRLHESYKKSYHGPRSEETKKAISASLKGKPKPWVKGNGGKSFFTSRGMHWKIGEDGRRVYWKEVEV